MKTATAFFRSSYRGNLSNILNTLIKANEINEGSIGRYALSQNTLTNMEKQVADAK